MRFFPLKMLKSLSIVGAILVASHAPYALSAEDCDANLSDDYIQCVMNGVLVVGTWGRDGRGGGVEKFIDGSKTEMRSRLVNDFRVPGGNIYRQAWNDVDDTSLSRSPSTGVHLKLLNEHLTAFNRSQPSYLALIGHSFGGWASLTLSRLSEVPKADLLFLIDPVIGLSNNPTGEDTRGVAKLIVNYYQDKYITKLADSCGIETGLQSCSFGVSCGGPVSNTGAPAAFNVHLEFQMWADGSPITERCFGIEAGRYITHTTIDDDRFVQAEASRLIIKGVSDLRSRSIQTMIRSIITGLGDKATTDRLAFFTEERIKTQKSSVLRSGYRNLRIDQIFQKTIARLPTDIERQWTQTFFTKGGTSLDAVTVLYLSLDLIGANGRTISLENIFDSYLRWGRDIDKVVEVLLGIDKTVYTYTWNEQEKTCNRSPRNMVVRNKMCGKGERQIQISGSTCDVLYDGEYRFTLQAGQDECPKAPVPLSGPVAAGFYKIKSRFSQKCIDLKDASNKEGSKFQQLSCSRGTNQVFNLNNISGDLYTMTVWSSQQCLSAETAGMDSGLAVVQHGCNFQSEQNVRLLPSAEGSYLMQFENNKMCVDVEGYSRDNGKEVLQTKCSGEADQDWLFIGTDPFNNPEPTLATDVSYEIVGNFSNKCLDVKDSSENNGGSMQQWECTGNANQRFHFTNVGDGYYNLKSLISGKCVRAESGKSDNGTRMVLWDCNGGADQKIRLEPSDNETYNLRFAHSKKCMDVAGTSADNGKEVHQWDCSSSTPDQKWTLKERDGTGVPAAPSSMPVPNPPTKVFMCLYKHKEDTKGGKKGETNFSDAFGKGKSCDQNGDWKTSCKDGDGKTDEAGCSSELPTSTAGGMCQYKHKKDTAGGKTGQVTALDAVGKQKACDKNADWKTTCKDGNGETEEVACK